MNCAMTGFCSMAACVAGELFAASITGAKLPDYAKNFSMTRYADMPLMNTLLVANKGVLQKRHSHAAGNLA